MAYPLTKMNFLVYVPDLAEGSMAAFSEVTGIEASVDVVEFRQGNAHSLAPVKIPGLVKHGNISLKMGYTVNNNFKKWIQDCVSETRGAIPRKTVTIELLNIQDNTPNSSYTSVTGSITWILKEAWVTKYSGPDLNASASEVAIETVELAYEELTIPD
jgi:phage tail-like protein